MIAVDNEIFAQYRQTNHRADIAQVVKVTLEKRFVRQHADRAGAVLLVDLGDCHRIEVGATQGGEQLVGELVEEELGVARQIQDGDSLILDTGSTTTYVAKALAIGADAVSIGTAALIAIFWL